MKTVIIFDQCGQDDLKFRVVEGDYEHLNGKYGNTVDISDEETDEINKLVFDQEGYLFEDFTTEFPTEAVRQGASVVIIGFVP